MNERIRINIYLNHEKVGKNSIRFEPTITISTFLDRIKNVNHVTDDLAFEDPEYHNIDHNSTLQQNGFKNGCIINLITISREASYQTDQQMYDHNLNDNSVPNNVYDPDFDDHRLILTQDLDALLPCQNNTDCYQLYPITDRISTQNLVEELSQHEIMTNDELMELDIPQASQGKIIFSQEAFTQQKNTIINFTLIDLDGERIVFEAEPEYLLNEITFEYLYSIDADPSQFYFIFNSHILDLSKSIKENGISSGSVIEMLLRPKIKYETLIAGMSINTTSEDLISLINSFGRYNDFVTYSSKKKDCIYLAKVVYENRNSAQKLYDFCKSNLLNGRRLCVIISCRPFAPMPAQLRKEKEQQQSRIISRRETQEYNDEKK